MVGYPDKDAEASAIIQEVFLHEARLDILDDVIKKKNAKLINLLKKASDLKGAMESDKIDRPDEIEEMEKIEMKSHVTSICLAAYSVERSRLVRLIMRKNAKIRKLGKEYMEEEGYDEEDDEDPALEEVWAKSAICMEKASVLEEHVNVAGHAEAAYIVRPGSKACLEEDELARYMARLPGGMATFNKWYYGKRET